ARGEGAGGAAKLALGFLLAGGAVVRGEYGRVSAGWLLPALAEEHGRAGHDARPPAVEQVDRGYDPAAGRAARRTRPDPARVPYDRDRRRDRRLGGYGD